MRLGLRQLVVAKAQGGVDKKSGTVSFLFSEEIQNLWEPSLLAIAAARAPD